MNSSNAIVVSQTPFGEADKYVQFFTQKWGMVTVLAKSARKSRRRYAGGLDLFCHDEIAIRGLPKQSPYLVELTVLNSFSGIRNSLERLLTAGKITQWVRRLSDTSVPMPEVFSLLGQTLSLTEKEPDLSRLNLLHLVFKFKLLALLGLKPGLENCLRCSEHDSDYFFDIEAGGILCEKCSSTQRTSRDQFWITGDEIGFLKATEPLRLTRWSQVILPPENIIRMNKLMTDFAMYHTHTWVPG